jgi:lipopolysaccharide/colanic/teichoic acid biosynthesis glycosyltransferase
MLKRIFDLIVAAAGMILLAPFLAVVAILVRLSSPGPAFFRQERVGRNGQTFVLFKFRTMGVSEDAEKGHFNVGDFERVTHFGRFLRKTKLDELPQLWNVIKGDMSLVGPRPEVKKWVEVYPEDWSFVHQVRPGLTDPASILYRHEEEILMRSADPVNEYKNVILLRKLKLYKEYIRNRSFFGDLVIICRTVTAIFSGVKRQGT